MVLFMNSYTSFFFSKSSLLMILFFLFIYFLDTGYDETVLNFF